MLFAALSLGFVHFSPALCSIFLAAAFAISLSYVFSHEKRPLHLPVFVALASAIVLYQLAAQLLFHAQGEPWGGKFLVKLPILVMPVLLWIRWNRKTMISWLVLISLPLSWIAVASVANYFRHFAFYNQMVLESKPVAIYSQVYHIEFSLILSVFSLLPLLVAYRFRAGERTALYWLLLASGIMNMVCLHILTARTGIMAFWIGAGIGLLVLKPWQSLKLWKFMVGLALVVIAFLAVPSLRNRIFNSIDDIKAVTGGKDLNNKSFGRRWVAWQAAVVAIKSQPGKGYGIQNVPATMEKAHQEKGTVLASENRILPHNQYLELAIQSGIPAAILMVLALILGLFKAWRSGNLFLASFLAAFAFASVFESLLERQAGVLLVAILLPVLAQWGQMVKEE
jgi:O-antigen ligase